MGDLVIGDSFILFNNELYNLTYTINYFDFKETRNALKENIQKVKDLKAENILGKRLNTLEAFEK